MPNKTSHTPGDDPRRTSPTVAERQAHREQIQRNAADRDRAWREAGWREQGGSREGWGLD
ncbi:hypothetical protein ACQEVC_45395 [Plantactinospora sp. CA-294935]|uniref:hypothetical protein n=1 Tax=Plantactinospora sp. CA-294935 TaxID=3240012 RepID=UPI003D9472DC